MKHRIKIASHLPATMQLELEALLFFNPRQSRLRERIEATIERWGLPEIVERDGWLLIRVAGSAEVQSLFAVREERGRSRPVGVIVYVRDSSERITVVHLGVAEDYAIGGPHASERVLLRLMQEIRRLARSTTGIRRVALAYRGDRPHGDGRFAELPA